MNDGTVRRSIQEQDGGAGAACRSFAARLCRGPSFTLRRVRALIAAADTASQNQQVTNLQNECCTNLAGKKLECPCSRHWNDDVRTRSHGPPPGKIPAACVQTSDWPYSRTSIAGTLQIAISLAQTWSSSTRYKPACAGSFFAPSSNATFESGGA